MTPETSAPECPFCDSAQVMEYDRVLHVWVCSTCSRSIPVDDRDVLAVGDRWMHVYGD